MNLEEAKTALDKVIRKTRSHFYKPIQIAEILYRDRTVGDIDLLKLETYRTVSRRWRDHICLEFVGRTSTSSARYQDDVFNENATPPSVLAILGQENRNHQGIVEAYIYRKFFQRLSQMLSGLDYCQQQDQNHFRLEEFLKLFWSEPGLKRSIDKIYEIVVYALFSVIIDYLEISVKVMVSESPDA
ncbi:MAG: HaeII family restriction endonuclease, partial [Microcystaceae cyanobacterium]